MIKKILSYLLLISCFSSGMAVAWDMHPEAVPGSDGAEHELVHDQNGHSEDEDEDCNDHHGCHSSAHFVGVLNDNGFGFLASNRNSFAFIKQSNNSPYISPLLRPPSA